MKKLIYLAIFLTLASCNERELEELTTTQNTNFRKNKNVQDSTEVEIPNNFVLDGQDPIIIVPPRR